MQKRGRTAAGTQRWKCEPCRISGVRTRPDTRTRHLRTHFVRWLTGVSSLDEVAQGLGISRQRLSTRFAPLWREPPPCPPACGEPDRCLVLDGVNLSGRTNTALVARNLSRVRSWMFFERECFAAWDSFLASLPRPEAVVMDGQKGLNKAVQSRFFGVAVQRCLVHVERFVRSRVSTRPKTDAGRELWLLTRSLWDVDSPADAERWRKRFADWQQRHGEFLKERSWSSETGRWWYKHRGLRAARSHLRNALPYLFTFTEMPNVPRTTNHVEGGVNSRLKELVRRHRGMFPEHKRILAAHFLKSKTKEKPPRNVT